MSQIVYFNGARLVKPGGASKLDTSAFEGVVTEGVGVVAVVGEAKNGKPLEWTAFTDPSVMEQYFSSGDLADAASVAFKPLNDSRVGNVSPTTVLAYKTNNGTQSAVTLQTSGSVDVLKLSSVDYGIVANGTTVAASYSLQTKVRTFTIRPPQSVYETRSTETIAVTDAECEKFTLYFDGTSNGPEIRTTDNATADGLIDIITLYSTVSEETLVIDLVANQIGSINALVDYINSHSSFWHAAVGTSSIDRFKFNPRLLDTQPSGTSVSKTPGTPTSIYAKLQQCIDRINNESRIVTAGLPATFASRAICKDYSATALAGGTDGTTGASALTDALKALEAFDAPHVVVLTTTKEAAIALEAHCAKMSATGTGKKERTGYIGIADTKTNLINAAQTINSPHLLIFSQKWQGTDRFNQTKIYPVWAWALAAACARSGMEYGEPLTWKYFASQDVIQSDATWSPEQDGEDMILAGLCIAQKDRRGSKIVKGITSYTRFDNDVLTEESIITNVKAMSKEFRELLELRYTGRKATLQTLTSVKSDAVEYWNQKRAQGRIVDSVVNGTITQDAWRKLTVRAVRDQIYVDVEISPVSGINFQLETIRLVPATISL